MKLPLYNKQAEKIDEIEVNDSIFNGPVNDKVLSQYIFIYLSNQRQGNAQTKDRSEVRGGGKKPWNQKGTGRARAGSSRSPIWRSGGVTFGPTNNVNWSKKTTKSFRASSFRNAFSKLQTLNKIKFINEININNEVPLTKQAIDLVKNFNSPKKVTIITAEKNSTLINAFSNLDKNRIVLVNDLNVYDLLNGGEIIIQQKALEYINNWIK